MFANLRFLVLVRFLWPSDLSLESLCKLKSLWFDDCNLKNFEKKGIKILPEKLESLRISDCITPERLKIPELNHLKRLEFYGIRELSLVSSTLKRLSSLEELRLPQAPIRIKHSKYLVDTIGELPGLKSLHIRSRRPASTNLATKCADLGEFRMFFGEPGRSSYMSTTSTGSPVSLTKSIKLFNHNLVEGYQTVIEKAEEVVLAGTDFTGGSIQIGDAPKFFDLRYMHIHDCDTMENLARISPQHKKIQKMPFSNLVVLEVKRCKQLKFLFCSSVARCLGQLQQLSIASCYKMEEVVLGEGTSVGIIDFSKLRILRLDSLTKLKCFYEDKDNTPSGPIPPLFGKMITFPYLEVLHINSLNDVTDIWGDDNDNASSFSKLKTLSVKSCKKLKTAISPAMFPRSLNSEVGTHRSNTDSATASTSVCRRIPMITKENLNDPSGISVQVPPQNTRKCLLDEMHLEELPCLETTGLNFEDQSGAVSSYPNLRILRIRKCKSLKNVFIPSPGRHFMDLEEMSVTKCIEMTEIIGAGKQKITNDIVFHKLLSLVLSDLPGLTSFWGCLSGEANNHKVKFPNLKSFDLSCSEITSLEMIELGGDDPNFWLEKLNISCDQEQLQIPDQWLPHLNNLESLTLKRCWSDKLKSLHFQGLKKLTLSQLSCSRIFSFPDFKRLQQLQEIEITECDSLEQIVEVVRGEEASGLEMKALLQLKKIILGGLPKLKSFLHTKSIISDGVEPVEVEPSILLTCSVFGNLQKLEKLQVINCRLLESIVEVAEGPGTSNPDDKIITFPQLSTINLRDLRKLKTFSPTTSYSFQMPKLNKVYLHGCPQVKKLTSQEIITGLVHVYTEGDRGGILHKQVNKCIANCHKRVTKKRKSVGESSNSNQHGETEAKRVEEEEIHGVVEQGEERNVVQEENNEEGPQEQRELKKKSKLMKLMRMIIPRGTRNIKEEAPAGKN